MEKNKYTFFWKDESPFSQWHRAGFIIDGVCFKTAEHYMMWRKAKLFSDDEVALEILKAKHPRDVKALGRKVKNFNGQEWEKICKDVVYEGNHAKFTQNPIILKKLLETEGTILVEASPSDKIWGIGLIEEEASKVPEQEWPGLNWLGEILTRLRKHLVVGRSNP